MSDRSRVRDHGDVLGVPVGPALLRRWIEWLAPDPQPFFVESPRSWPKGSSGQLDPALRDTYRLWRVDGSLKVLWLDEESFLAMPRQQRTELVREQLACGRGATPTVRRWSDLVEPTILRSQAGGHRFLWWPSLVATNPEVILARVVEAAPDGGAPSALASRHRDVEPAAWQACRAVLPGARDLAGSFPDASGPNCFGTVMAAAGGSGAAAECMLQEPFLDWVGSTTRPGGDDSAPGTVLVWRDGSGLPVHAAVTIGYGWALEKASGEWWTPRAIRRVKDVIRTTRATGQRLERHHLTGS